MFINKEEEQKNNSQKSTLNNNQPQSNEDHVRHMIIFGGFVVALLVLILIVFAFMTWYSRGDNQPEKTGGQEATTTKNEGLGSDGGLPEESGNSATSSDQYLSDVEAEKLTFGQFFQDPKIPELTGAEKYSLPINVKEEVANYHKVDRRVKLDDYIQTLDANGFAVFENQFKDKGDNFYKSYRLLNSKDVPVLITSDFLLYHYHNILKRDFKIIEENIFYKNLWNINKDLYTKAKNKYENRREEVGVANDPLLEARRLETAFFATSLKLLEPLPKQTSKEVDKLAREDKFSVEEAAQYSIELPKYLKPDVTNEVELIRKRQKKEKDSPVLLYERDYKQDFKVPKRYQDSARLNNFYLASNWLHSVFPLYHKTNICKECLLDKEDWRISMIASFLIADDFSSEQQLKNKWARIYKVISYFQGLRDDLTYLHYDQVLKDYKGDDQKLKQLFDSYEQTDKSLKDMQKKLAKFDFSGLGGGFDKNTTSTMAKQGLKVLASPYWPNDFIFKKLTFPNVRYYQPPSESEAEENVNAVGCTESRMSTQVYRCRGFGGDIVNLIYSASSLNKYFTQNTNYEFYDREIQNLLSSFEKFDKHKWHSNSYWTLLNIADKYLQGVRSSVLPFASGDDWQNRRVDASLGAWTDLQTSRDKLKIYNLADEGEGLTGTGIEFINKNSYIEPELELVQQLRANTDMLYEMFQNLGVTYEAVSIDDDLKRMSKEFSQIENIIKKELSDKSLSDDNYTFIDNFIKQYKVEEESKKKITIDFERSKKGITESIEGVKLMVVTYKKGGKKYFAVGPVYNYKEYIER